MFSLFVEGKRHTRLLSGVGVVTSSNRGWTVAPFTEVELYLVEVVQLSLHFLLLLALKSRNAWADIHRY